MEPQNPEKHNEGSGFRKQSISSILKAPRKSILLRDFEQRENEVESTKPVEKRNSRRVSFASANDVLLFANDMKNTSPARNPLQELTAPTVVSTQNRAQAELKAEKSQQISGRGLLEDSVEQAVRTGCIENLLKAPLHAPMQTNAVNPNVWNEIGEKTVVFSAEDAIMDMTHSHTINIGSDADLLGKTYLSERTGEAGLPDLSVNMTTRRSTDFSGQKGSLSAIASSLDPEFEDFLASLTKQSSSCVGPAFAGPPRESSGGVVSQSKTPRVEAVKENRLPGLENSTKKIGEGFGGSMVCPKVETSVDEFLTEPQMGQSLGVCGKDNMFQCLFPTLDMFAEKGASQQPNRTSDRTDVNSASPLHQKRVSSPAKGEKTVTFSVEDDFMDIAHSPTVNASSWFSSRKLTGSFDPSSNDLQSKSSDPSLCSREGRWSVNRSSAEPGPDPEGDVSMEMTEVQMGCIKRLSDSQDPFQFVIPSQKEVFPLNRSQEKADTASGQENIKGSSTNRGVETSLKPSIKSPRRSQARFGLDNGEKTGQIPTEDDCMDITQSYTANGNESQLPFSNVDLNRRDDRTVRFTLTDAAMEETKSHTVFFGFQQTFLQHTEALPSNGDKTTRFTANDAVMDVTKSHTVNIDADLRLIQLQSVESLPTNADKTQMYDLKESAMNVTKDHTINITANLKGLSQSALKVFEEEKPSRPTTINDAVIVTQSHSEGIPTRFEPTFHQSKDVSPSKEDKTVRFTLSDAAMDVTKSHTVNIDADLDAIQQQDVDFLPIKKDKHASFTADNTTMNVTKNHSVVVAADLHVLPRLTHSDKEKSFRSIVTDEAADETRSYTANISTSVEPVSGQSLDALLMPGEKVPSSDTAMNETRTLSANIATNFPSEVTSQPDAALSLHVCKPQLGLEQELNKSMSQASVPVDNLKTRTMSPLETQEPNGCPSDLKPEQFPDKTTANCPQIFEGLDVCRDQTCSTEGRASAEIQTQSVFALQDHKVSSESQEMLRSCNTKIPNPQDCVTSSQAELVKKPEPATLGFLISLEQESPSVDQHETLKSQRSRRKSLADLQTKVRRLSHLINAAPDAVAMETAPLPQTDQDLYKNASDKTASTPTADLQLQEASNTEPEAPDLCHQEGEQPVATATADATLFSCKTKQLISRLSVGAFKPKLPLRSCPEDPNKASSAGEPSKSVCLINELNNPEEEISNIYDEELDSCEDVSETIDSRSPKRITEEGSPPEELKVDPLEKVVFEEEHQGQKRPLMENDDEREDKKRLKAASEFELMSEVDERDISRTRTATLTTDSSSRCEAAFDSTIKNSLCASQLEDSISDAQKKLEDGTITVSEFFKLFNIEFVIHDPRQSVLPSRLLSETDATTMYCLKNRHISRPKQRVYEADVQNLSQEVQRLKVRTADLKKPLSRVNPPLWEQIRLFSEKELKAFGAQLKARSNFFRKQSKVQSHHMKEVLYSNIISAHREEQQMLRGRLEQADQMIGSLDGCIAELEAELAKVEEIGSEDKPSVKSLQEDMEKVTKALADGERQVAELEMQKQQNLNQVKKLKEETKKLQTYMDMLETVNEWRLKEKSQNATVYSFLHDTVFLQLVFPNSDGSDPEAAAEQRLKDIVFRLTLNEEKSHDYARLVHTLLSQFVSGQSAWMEQYPTKREVPKLLHDVSLAVSRCRLLGEELRLLKMWGGMRLNILSLTCTDTRIHVVFSSLKVSLKFKVVFFVSLAGLVYHLNVESFQSLIGKTSIQQIEDIVASFTPSRNLLTKICKKIHQTLLC